MKLLMFYADDWWYRNAEKGLVEAPDAEREESFPEGAAVIFVHAEEKDEEGRAAVTKKFLKNVKWIAGKFSTKNVVLHSFNHLSMSKSSPEFALSVMDEVDERLKSVGYTVMRTPFGYFNEFKIHVAGDSLAKVYKEF
jgi:hypothetical protein